MGKETSTTLDYLLSESGYDRKLRPVNDGGPVQVNVNLAIRSMGPPIKRLRQGGLNDKEQDMK